MANYAKDKINILCKTVREFERTKLVKWFANQTEDNRLGITERLFFELKNHKMLDATRCDIEALYSFLMLAIHAEFQRAYQARLVGAQTPELFAQHEEAIAKAEAKSKPYGGKKPNKKYLAVEREFTVIQQMREKGKSYDTIKNYLNANVKAFKGPKKKITLSYLRRAFLEIQAERTLLSGDATIPSDSQG